MSDLARFAADVGAAAARIREFVAYTPCLRSPWLSTATGGDVRLKLENVQQTGSFKLRGATNALLGLSPERRARGVVAASSGNHGLGVATACAGLGAPALVFVPTTTPAAKVDAIVRAGAEVTRFGEGCLATEQRARAEAMATDRTYVSPYNDPAVVAGQGTVAVELAEQFPEAEVVYVAVGGGGLIGGMAAYWKALRGGIEFVGCSPAASPAMAECVRQGSIVDVPCGETWSDSTAGGVEPGAVTFDLCRALVDRWIAVDEHAIAAAIVAMLEHEHLLVEGAAAVALAACLQDRALRGRRAVVVVCGGNLPRATLTRLLA